LRKTTIAVFILLLLLAPMLSFSQSRETGAITGKAVDEQGAPLPGVSLTLSGEKLMGTRSTVSDGAGNFRFPALPPGTYSLKAELQGFGTVVQESIRLTTTSTLSLTMTLKPATVQEQITVIAESPTVDIKSTETASVTLSNEILRNIPNSQFTADIVNLAPGVNNDSAYGAAAGRGISYQMDGVGVGDPDGGTAWVFADYNIVEEAKVMGIGLPAEYGNFTGVIFNIVTKSGGNDLSGHFEWIYQGNKKGLWGTQNNAAYYQNYDPVVDPWPYVTSPIESLFDINGHLGGPFIKDKLWFFAGGQFYRSKNWPSGFPFAQDYKQPRFYFKLSSQLWAKTSISAALEYDNYNGTYRNAGESSQYDPIATTEQIDPEFVLNFNLTHIMSAKTFFDVKAAYFNGYYNLEPMSGDRTISGHRIVENDQYVYDPNWTGTPSLSDPTHLAPNHRYSNVWFYAEHPRQRLQANASLTTYAEDFIKGSHDFKFGVEFEKSQTRNLYAYTGVNHWYYYDYWGGGYYGNYSANQYEGYNTRTNLTRLEGFAQDSWQVSKRLNLSFGVRLSQNWGAVGGLKGVPYSEFRIAPRLGFTFDLLGDKSTILKGHYGEFTDGVYGGMLDRLNPEWSDKITWYWDPDGAEWYEGSRDVHGTWTVDPEIKHPFMRQFTVGIERELFKDASFSVTYINRTFHNFQSAFNRLATYEPVDMSYEVWDPVAGELVDRTFQFFDLTSGDAVDWHLTDASLVADYLNETYGIDAKPYRKYWGIEVLFNKRFSNRWQMLASYVYSKSRGTVGNSSAYRDIGWNSLYDPNYWINADGPSSYDPTHMLKIQGSYLLPLGISFNAYFHAITGDTWTQLRRTGSRDLYQGRLTFNVEQSGKYHYPMLTQLDLRLEKIFTLADKYRLGLVFDIFNVFNDNTITSWGNRINYDWVADDPTYSPSTQGHDLLGLTLPRRARVGIRFIF
jgi:outer membrane receptor protein involved in Fe transport